MMNLWFRRLSAALAVSLASGATLGSASDQVDIVLFPTPQALPLYVAADKGLFSEQGIDVELTKTPDSPYLVSGLANNDFQVALAAVDNFIAYQENQHVADYQPGHDVFVFMGGGETNLSLVAQPDITDTQELRGKTVAVDTPVTGFAFVLYRMLEEAGLSRDDYEITEAGATNLRWEGLRQKDFDATLLVGGLANAARAQGYSVLAESRDVLGTYQGTVLASNTTWAESNRDVLVRFTTAVLDALDWIHEADNSDEAARILARNLDMPVDAARGALAGMTDGPGLTRDGSVLLDGMRVVLDLRSDYANSEKKLEDPGKYLDLSYYQEAKRQR